MVPLQLRSPSLPTPNNIPQAFRCVPSIFPSFFHLNVDLLPYLPLASPRRVSSVNGVLGFVVDAISSVRGFSVALLLTSPLPNDVLYSKRVESKAKYQSFIGLI